MLDCNKRINVWRWESKGGVWQMFLDCPSFHLQTNPLYRYPDLTLFSQVYDLSVI